jgi:hypothetical protein
MPIRHQHLAMPLFDQMPLHVHGDVTYTGAQTGYQQYQRQNRHRTSQRDYGPAAQQEGVTRLTV